MKRKKLSMYGIAALTLATTHHLESAVTRWTEDVNGKVTDFIGYQGGKGDFPSYGEAPVGSPMVSALHSKDNSTSNSPHGVTSSSSLHKTTESTITASNVPPKSGFSVTTVDQAATTLALLKEALKKIDLDPDTAETPTGSPTKTTDGKFPFTTSDNTDEATCLSMVQREHSNS